MEAREQAGRQGNASRRILSVWRKTARTLPKMRRQCNGGGPSFPLANYPQMPQITRDLPLAAGVVAGSEIPNEANFPQ
jgi:hypothetical protein